MSALSKSALVYSLPYSAWLFGPTKRGLSSMDANRSSFIICSAISPPIRSKITLVSAACRDAASIPPKASSFFMAYLRAFKSTTLSPLLANVFVNAVMYCSISLSLFSSILFCSAARPASVAMFDFILLLVSAISAITSSEKPSASNVLDVKAGPLGGKLFPPSEGLEPIAPASI